MVLLIAIRGSSLVETASYRYASLQDLSLKKERGREERKRKDNSAKINNLNDWTQLHLEEKLVCCETTLECTQMLLIEFLPDCSVTHKWNFWLGFGLCTLGQTIQPICFQGCRLKWCIHLISRTACPPPVL